VILEGKVNVIRHLVHTSEVKVAGQTGKGLPPGVQAIEVFIIITENTVTLPPATELFKYAGDVKKGIVHGYFCIRTGRQTCLV
jgi:hypothetical protein